MEEKEVINFEEKRRLDYSAVSDLVTLSKSVQSTQFTLDDINNWILAPMRYGSYLRNVSDIYYNKNGIYKNICNTFANLPTLDFLILPSSKTLGKLQDKAYSTYFDKVNAYTEAINIKLTTRRILKSVARYGAYIGYQRSQGSNFAIQTLPIDYCRIKYKIGNDYQLEYNFKYFDKFFNAEDLELAWTVYPPEFKKLYNKYKADKKSQYPEWQMLDIASTVCIQYDDDDAYFLPLFTGIFESLYYNDEYKGIMQMSSKLDVTKLITQKVPTDKDGNLLIPRDLVKIFHDELTKILPDGASALTTPLEIHDVPFTNHGKDREDILAKSERAVYVASGMSSSLFADNGGHVGLTMNIEAVTANIFSILEKIEDVFTKKFLKVVNSKNYIFKLKFFRTTNINIKETFDRMYQLVAIGGAIQPLFSLSGLDTESYITLLQIESDLKIKDLLTIPESVHTQTASAGATDKGGKPAKDEKDLKDSGATTKDLDTNNKAKKVK